LLFLFTTDIPLSVLLTFKRLQSLTTDESELIAALKDSSIVKIDPGRKMIKRIAPLPEDEAINKRIAFSVNKAESGKSEPFLNKRTLLSTQKGWPADATIEEVTQACSALGTVLSVRLRRRKDKTQKVCACPLF
jgi:hypothetical protein